jgi:hypothetical protein
MRCDIGTVIEYAKASPESYILTSSRRPVPVPIGARFKIETLHQAADLIEQLGPSCIREIEKVDDGSIQVGYHFD